MSEMNHTPGPWKVFNMVHEERGGPMTPEEIGEYVKANVIKSIEDGGSADRFLFVSTEGENAPDICHVGNGPRGPFNARLIAAAPDLLEALQLLQGQDFRLAADDHGAEIRRRAAVALAKATA